MNTMGNQQGRLSREYVAGLMCGEAWFGLTCQKTPRLKTKNGFTVLPRIVLQMDDTETMLMVQEAFIGWEMAFYVERIKRPGLRLAVVGCRRCLRFLDFFLPVLTGQKRRAAEVMRDYILLRLSKPQPSPYGAEEMEYVNKIRALNAGNGKQRITLREAPSETARHITPPGS